MIRYKIINSQKSLTETKLNEFGRRGYELVSVIEDQYGYKYYFKINQEE